MNNQHAEKNENEMILTRTFQAPRKLVFEAYSKCEHLMNWYGGEEWPLIKCEIDFREGGRWSYCMENPDIDIMCGLAIYKEINQPKKIVYRDHFLDEDGEISKELPSSLISLEFIEENKKTKIVNRWEYPTKADLDKMIEMGAIEGLTEVWDRLDEHLVNIQ